MANRSAVPDLFSSPSWRDDRSAHWTILYTTRSHRIPRNGNRRVLRKYKSGAFSQNTPATSSRTEPSSGIPLGAPNVREKLSGSAAALFQRFGYARVSLRDITSFVDIPNFCARAWSVPAPAHQHFAGEGSGAPLPSRTADRRRHPALEH